MNIRRALYASALLLPFNVFALTSPAPLAATLAANIDASGTQHTPENTANTEWLLPLSFVGEPQQGKRLQLAGDAPCNPKVTVCDD